MPPRPLLAETAKKTGRKKEEFIDGADNMRRGNIFMSVDPHGI